MNKTLQDVLNEQKISRSEMKKMLTDIGTQLLNEEQNTENSDNFSAMLTKISEGQNRVISLLEEINAKEMPEMPEIPAMPDVQKVEILNPSTEFSLKKPSWFNFDIVTPIKALYTSWIVMLEKTIFSTSLEKGNPDKPQYVVLVDEKGHPVDLTKLIPQPANQKIRRSGSGAQVHNEVPSGAIDGVNAVFTLQFNPTQSSLKLYLNGARQKAGGEDFTLSVGTITFTVAPTTNSIILADYTI